MRKQCQQMKIALARAEKDGEHATGPIIYVCPSGTHRCGTMAALDIILDRITAERKVALPLSRNGFLEEPSLSRGTLPLSSLKETVLGGRASEVVEASAPSSLRAPSSERQSAAEHEETREKTGKIIEMGIFLF